MFCDLNTKSNDNDETSLSLYHVFITLIEVFLDAMAITVCAYYIACSLSCYKLDWQRQAGLVFKLLHFFLKKLRHYQRMWYVIANNEDIYDSAFANFHVAEGRILSSIMYYRKIISIGEWGVWGCIIQFTRLQSTRVRHADKRVLRGMPKVRSTRRQEALSETAYGDPMQTP